MSTVLKRFSLVGVAVALLATGCGTGPAKAGSAAIVGDQTINLETVQDRTVKVLKKEPAAQQMQDQGKLDQVSKLVLADEISHLIAARAAERENITVDETKVYDAIQEKGGPEAAAKQSEQDETTIYRRQRDVLVMGELARRNLSTLEVVIDFFQVQDPKEAKEKAAEVVADSSKMSRFVQEAPRTSTGQQASATNQRVRVTENPSLVHTMLWGVKPGTVVAFPADEQQSSWMVALVKERNKVSARPGEEDLVERIDPQLLAAFGLRIAQFLSADLNIEVNPRYGVWDPTNAQVVGNAGERAGFVGVAATKNKS
ncbi:MULTISPECIES: hypothetical protein [Lentzea]|uniref:SurA N-terminal domain-containing protein n=1 Tax=Lentzea albida TaxID=65499 RepID=A0A1H9BYJ6_9PSEU|nr:MULTISPECIES: hypothetical protein [Lentzea]USX49381.1 hypothetical protein ND450_28550 [Lentzea sp. HUAS12]SEP94065.1 hypothetical protein SAMN04488000_101742 [Lentzea albida]